jgi:hypothetical protein
MLQLHCFSTPFGTKGEDANHFWSHFFFFFFWQWQELAIANFLYQKVG